MKVLILFLSLISGHFLFAQDTLLLDRLDYRLHVEEDGETRPAIRLDRVSAASVFIACGMEGQLEICGPYTYDVWVNGKYLVRKPFDECLYLSNLSEWCDKEEVHMSLSTSHHLGGVQIRRIQLVDQTIQEEARLLSYREWDDSDWWILAFLMIGVILLVYRDLSSAPLLSFMSIRRLDDYQARFLSENKNFSLLFVALFGSFVWVYLQTTPLDPWTWAKTFVAIGTYFLVVRWMQALTVALFRIPDWKDEHFTNLIQLSLFLSVVLLAIALLDFLFSTSGWVRIDVVKWALAVIYFVHIIRRVFKVMFKGRHLKLHLFAYLCTTEILPVGFIIYWLVY